MIESPEFWEWWIQFTIGVIGGIIGSSLMTWWLDRRNQKLNDKPPVITAHFLP